MEKVSFWLHDFHDIYMDRFDVICVAQGIGSVAHKVQIFLATLKDEALNWYFNLDQVSQAAYEPLLDYFFTIF